MPNQTQSIVLNLRRYQARFLQLLSDATGLERSQVCQHLIALHRDAAEDAADNPLRAPGVLGKIQGFSRQSGERAWTRVTVNLPVDEMEGLQLAANGEGDSESRALRHLIEAFIAEVGSGKHSASGSARSRSGATARAPGTPAWIPAAIACLLLVLLGIVFYALRDEPQVEVGPHWAGSEASLILDPHAHTTYSDGALNPTELVQMAIDNGCDAIVVADHANTEGAVSDAQLLELQLLREQFPDFLLFNGLELNMPSYGGREHATLIADPLVAAGTLQSMRDTAERSLKKVENIGSNETADEQILEMIAEHQSLQNGLLLMYNHPARKVRDISENFTDLLKWNASAPVFLLLEGGPGHQNSVVVGRYEEPYLTKDRWDPVVAEIGGVWDQWLGTGRTLWAALASSDYHNERLDMAPCAFARTHLVVPEQSYRGVMMALRSGTFWADHGRILNQLWFSLSVEGLEEKAFPGYTVYLGERDLSADLSVAIERGPGSLEQPLEVEFIGSCRSGASEVLATVEVAPDASEASTVIPLAATGQDGKSCIVRARLRLRRDIPTDYLAYTNPIRLVLER
jgi:hypothetical protein